MWATFEINYQDVKIAKNRARKYRQDIQHLIEKYRTTGDRTAYALIGSRLALYKIANRGYQEILTAYAENLRKTGHHG